MHSRMLDWDDLRFCLSAARHGNFTAAAEELAVTQPTVGRRIRAFEKRLGAQLFVRAPAGLELTEAGERLLGHARAMEAEALAAERSIGGRDEGVAGTMRVTASEWLVQRVLAPGLAAFIEQHPAATVELAAATSWANLARRDADVAIRPAPFEHHEVVQRKVGTVAFGVYASEGYLRDHGQPDWSSGCPGHRILLMNVGTTPILDVAWLTDVAHRAHLAARSNGREAQAAMAAANMGIACLPRLVGDAMPALRLLSPPSTPPSRRLRMGVHRDAKDLARIRALRDHLAGLLERASDALDP